MEIELQEAIQKDKLILFIGSGLSKRFGFPDWKELLIQILEKLGEDYLNFIPLLNKNLITISDVLDKLESNHKGVVTKQLEEVFSKFPDDVDFLFHKKLLELSSKVITTNYDKAFENADSSIYVANIFDDFTINQLSNKENYLFKLHGCVSSPANCILFPSQYKKMYSSEEKSSVFKLKNLVQQNTILFIGYSMSDIEIESILKNIKSIFGGYSPKHFIISTDDFSKNEIVSNYPHPKLLNYSELDTAIDNLIKFKEQKNGAIIKVSDESRKTKIESFKNTELTVEEELINFEYLEQNILDFRKKFSKQYTVIFFNKIISKDSFVHFTEQEYNDLLIFFKSDSYSWDKKVILLGSLTISGMKNDVLDEKMIELFISIIENNQDEIWQRALLGLVLNLLRWDKMLEGNKTLVARLENLKNQSKVQDAYFFIADMLKKHKGIGWKDSFEHYKKHREDKLSPELSRYKAMNFIEENKDLGLALIFTEFKEYSKEFFSSENWFLPYSNDNDFVRQVKTNCIHNVDINLLEELINDSISISSSQKYSLLGNINRISLGQIERLFEIFLNEKRGLSKIDKKELEFVNISDFWKEILQFYYSFPDNKIKDIELQQLQLSQNLITKLILKEERFNKIQGIYYNDLAYDYSMKNDVENAEIFYLKALEVDSNNGNINRNYAVFLCNRKNDYLEAEKFYLKALEIESESADFNCSYAIFLHQKNDFEDAEKYYQKSLSIDSENSNTIGSYANLLFFFRKDYINAEKHYIKAIILDSENASFNGNYAIFLDEVKKDYEKAEIYYRKSLSADSNSFIANRNYAIFLQEIRKDYDNAEKYYLKALSIEPDNVRINSNYGIFLFHLKKDFVNAEKYFLKTISNEIEGANEMGNYSQLLLNMDRKGEAKKFIKKAFFLNKNEKNGLSLELWFYKYAHYFESIEESEKVIESLLNEGINSEGWVLNHDVEIAIKKGHPNPEKLKEFARRISMLEY